MSEGETIEAGKLSDLHKKAMDDAVHKQKSCFDLIQKMDSNATTMCGICLSIITASVSALYVLQKAAPGQSLDFWTRVAMGAALIMVIGFTFAAYYFFITTKGAPIDFPGEDPKFWLHYWDSDTKTTEIVKTYLERAQGGIDFNVALNKTMSIHMKKGRDISISTVALAGFFVLSLSLYRISSGISCSTISFYPDFALKCP